MASSGLPTGLRSLTLLAALLLLHSAGHQCHASGTNGAAELPRTGDYENLSLLDGGFELFWSVNSSAETIHMAARAKTKGWLAVGISDSGPMIGSDAMIGWVSDGVVYATDRFIFNKSADGAGIVLDAQQDWHLVGGQETVDQSTGDTWTTIHFWRKLDTADCNDRPISAAGVETLIVWATGSSDSFAQHDARGMTPIVFIPSPNVPSVIGGSPSGSSPGGAAASSIVAASVPGYNNDEAGVTQFNFSFTGLKLPAQLTTYRCQVFEVAIPTKSHAVEWGPVINSSHPAVLHHALLYGCPADMSFKGVQEPGDVFECEDRVPCNVPFGLWAMGGRPFLFPKDVGMVVGPGYFTKFVIQMHYSNPDLIAGVVDNSGIYLKFGPPRKFEAGMMASVVYDRMIIIPPGMPSWTRVNTCPSVCTKAAFKDDGGINIFASAHHMHALGRQLYTDVYRNNRKIANLTRSDFYDFSSQQILRLESPFKLLPGDELKTTCVWDSSLQKKITTGGPASTQEMCIDYLLYYPARFEQYMNFCFDFCFDGSSRYMCANKIFRGNDKCNMSYGEQVPRNSLRGCPAESVSLLSDVPSDKISTAAAADAQSDSSDTAGATAAAAAAGSKAAAQVWGFQRAVVALLVPALTLVLLSTSVWSM